MRGDERINSIDKSSLAHQEEKLPLFFFFFSVSHFYYSIHPATTEIIITIIIIIIIMIIFVVIFTYMQRGLEAVQTRPVKASPSGKRPSAERRRLRTTRPASSAAAASSDSSSPSFLSCVSFWVSCAANVPLPKTVTTSRVVQRTPAAPLSPLWSPSPAT